MRKRCSSDSETLFHSPPPPDLIEPNQVNGKSERHRVKRTLGHPASGGGYARQQTL